MGNLHSCAQVRPGGAAGSVAPVPARAPGADWAGPGPATGKEGGGLTHHALLGLD